MAQRRGYADEYHVKRLLEKQYGKNHVIKVAVSQKAPDYLVITDEGLIGVEVKGRHQPKYRPADHDKKQWAMIKEWMESTGVPVYYYLITRVANGKSTKLCVDTIAHIGFGERYIKDKIMVSGKNL